MESRYGAQDEELCAAAVQRAPDPKGPDGIRSTKRKPAKTQREQTPPTKILPTPGQNPEPFPLIIRYVFFFYSNIKQQHVLVAKHTEAFRLKVALSCRAQFHTSLMFPSCAFNYFHSSMNLKCTLCSDICICLSCQGEREKEKHFGPVARAELCQHRHYRQLRFLLDRSAKVKFSWFTARRRGVNYDG